MSRAFVPTAYPLVNVVQEPDDNGQMTTVGYITSHWRRYQEGVATAITPGSSGEVLTSNGVSLVWSQIANAHIGPAAAIAYSKLNLSASIVNADIAGAAAIAYSKLNLALSIVNADIAAGAAIVRSKLSIAANDLAWALVDKTGSSLADLATRSASDLSSGTLAHARKWTQDTTAATGNQDDVNFAAVDSLRCNNAALLTIRGLLAGVGGQRLRLWAINAQLDVANQDANSAAANRIITTTGATVTVTRYADVEYDGTTQRWRMAAFV